MGGPARQDENPEEEYYAVEGKVPPLVSEVEQCGGDGKVRDAGDDVGDDMERYKSRLPGKAGAVLHVIADDMLVGHAIHSPRRQCGAERTALRVPPNCFRL